jgi:5-methylthioribose kinase
VIEQLEGGVSSIVWKIVTSDKRIVLKQALAKLNVKVDWFSDVARIKREEEAMRFIEQLLPPNIVPQILYSDSNKHLYIMTCAPEDSRTWKSRLMDGDFNPETAKEIGELLRDIHKNSKAKTFDTQSDSFQDLTYFDQLRIEPFYRYISQHYPQYEPQISCLVKELTEERECLVHGDFSPKNILVDKKNGIVLLDFEVAHWGNPVFDVSFMLTHLFLKGWGLNRKTDAYLLIQLFVEGYSLETNNFLPHMGLLLLARLDGISTVEYIQEERMKHQIRSIAIRWLQISGDINALHEIAKALKEDL